MGLVEGARSRVRFFGFFFFFQRGPDRPLHDLCIFEATCKLSEEMKPRKLSEEMMPHGIGQNSYPHGRRFCICKQRENTCRIVTGWRQHASMKIINFKGRSAPCFARSRRLHIPPQCKEKVVERTPTHMVKDVAEAAKKLCHVRLLENLRTEMLASQH